MTREGKLFDHLHQIAAVGAPMPSTRQMSDATDIPQGSIQMMLTRLAHAGNIVVETMDHSNYRKRVSITGTALRTDWQRPHPGNPGGRGHGEAATPVAAMRERLAPEAVAARHVDRDPCFYCGVRADHVPPCGCGRAA